MDLQLALKYRVKFGEEQQFLEADEVMALNRFIGAAIEKLGANATQEQKVLAAREAQKRFLAEELPAELIPVRISKNLIWTAVNLRYTVPGPQGSSQVQIPRKAEGRSKPGIWWGEIQDHFETIVDESDGAKILTTVLPLDPVIANWLVLTVWQDEKVQNGFPPQLQMWMNTLDAEFDRLAEDLGGSRKK